MDKLNIREATTDDLALVQRLGIETYRQHYADIWTSTGLDIYLNNQFNSEKSSVSLRDPNTRYYVSSVFDHPIGLKKLKWSQPVPTAKAKEGLELEKIYLLEDFVGKGYGGQMMEFVFRFAAENKAPLIWLDVLKSNVAGIRFYERYGFKIIGEIPFATDKKEIGMWIMVADA